MHGGRTSFGAQVSFVSTSMVSLQAALSPEDRKACPDLENSLCKKRKCRDAEASEDDWFVKEAKFVKAEEDDIRLNLDAPLPLEWQRCLDLKSGEIHFYNTRTHRRTSRDPRLNLEPPSSPLSLDLELNLACEPPRSHIDGGGREEERRKQDNSGGKACSLSWVSLDAGPEEMMATVCMRCHMLVMMNKATLSCPNCKFIHPPDHGSSTSIKPGFKLLCCKD
ncbi:unnamed protein product [Musa acuminata subsp. malaccensis]|nr:PREDICTED: uncharacterized protein LOC103991503 [Musa acuminata subsp. malaccensis]CAG1859563.1 unnamed protein product [Musa acuminata subsp. malaccensis]